MLFSVVCGGRESKSQNFLQKRSSEWITIQLLCETPGSVMLNAGQDKDKMD